MEAKRRSAQEIALAPRQLQAMPAEQIEGYCDLALAYPRQGEQELAMRYLRQALEKDPHRTREGLRGDGKLEHLLERLEAQG